MRAGDLKMAIRPCTAADVPQIFSIVNDAARAYQGTIPSHHWREPYMPLAHLQQEIAEGVRFWGYEADGQLVGVMGMQGRRDVELIRHAYVKTTHRKGGIGGALLKHLESMTTKPILIGTWAAASWAIDFYQKHGYRPLSADEAARLLRTYWNIPEQQIEVSVVLASSRWPR